MNTITIKNLNSMKSMEVNNLFDYLMNLIIETNKSKGKESLIFIGEGNKIKDENNIKILWIPNIVLSPKISDIEKYILLKNNLTKLEFNSFFIKWIEENIYTSNRVISNNLNMEYIPSNEGVMKIIIQDY